MKTRLLIPCLLFPLPIFAALVQTSPPVRSTDTPAVVTDLDASVKMGFRNLRTSSDPLKPADGAALPSTAGLAALHESGSSEFSVAGLQAMLGRFSGPVTVFDLRQEDHGFINGQPVSWYATNNWANVGKSNSEIVAEEKARLEAIRPGLVIAIGSDKAKKSGGPALAHPTAVAAAQTESQVVTAAGASYVRITVSDHSRPSDAEVDRFIEAVRRLPANGWAHFHCRAGRGRTTTFMAMYDMLRNARTVSLLDIDHRQSLLAVDYDVLGRGGESGENAGVAADRAAFVRAFYDYAKANPNGQPLLWTEWLKTQP